MNPALSEEEFDSMYIFRESIGSVEGHDGNCQGPHPEHIGLYEELLINLDNPSRRTFAIS